ncbi:hypothetical protein RRG08_055938 [Elysia crispata]|uniref:Uncharacterized protein n=1 Tax=Elysia crispata TaxID=231223 RepID=A0AAE0Z917_9GAST|nr:hypothetical protein RRG08_055938 [Elysia crispata]
MKFFLFFCSIGALSIYPLDAFHADMGILQLCVTNYTQFMMIAAPKGADQRTWKSIFCKRVGRDMSCSKHVGGNPTKTERLIFHSTLIDKMKEMKTICQDIPEISVGALHHSGANTILGLVSVQLVMISAAVTWAGKVRP